MKQNKPPRRWPIDMTDAGMRKLFPNWGANRIQQHPFMAKWAEEHGGKLKTEPLKGQVK